MNVYDETKYIMQKYGVHPNKKLGQNFLIDEETLDIITSDISKNDTIIEIGPGLGTLTSRLLERAKKVYAIELDKQMVEILKDRFKLYSNLEIINEDILKIDINALAPNAKVVANLPYYITTSIITKILKTDIADITLLIQKEVADRICAYPSDKEAGAITYFVYYYADSRVIKDVKSDCFIPSPKVDSAVVKLVKLDCPRVFAKNEEKLFKIIKENFTKRRKTILNSLSNVVEKKKLEEILKELNISENTRGENLTLEQFAEISNRI